MPRKMFRTVSAILIVSMDDRFGVAVGVEGVSEFFELLAQLEIVVDLAVKNDPRRAILIVNRLLPALEIDDREAAHCQADGSVDIEAVFVRAAMPDRFIHAGQQRFVNRLAVVSNESNDSTHIWSGILHWPVLIC